MIDETVSHYRILKILGSGGMGEVYLAEDTRLGRSVAVKFLSASYQYDKDRRERFLREARAASALRSPNVAAIYDIGEHEGAMYMAMEFCEGDLLSTMLEHGPLGVHQSIDIAIQVAGALDEAHSVGIVHRDIKSSNLIITPRGLVKVLDFGVAKMFVTPESTQEQSDERTVQLGKETAPGIILGTIAYMSPEQARGLGIDGRSDLYSLGVLLYEMLTRTLPFEGATTGDLLVSVLSKDPPSLAAYSTQIPAEMQWIVSKALRKDKTLRYQTARDFIIDLKNLASGLKTKMLPPETQSERHPGAEAPRARAAKKSSGPRSRKRKSVDSIAVLPLINSTDNPDFEYLSDGITESLINTLSRIPKLRVMARSTVFKYKGRDIDPQRVGAELNVRAVFTGRLRRVGEKFLFGAELVDVNDGSLLWGEQYTRRLSGILSLQDEISADIGEKLRLKLSTGERRKLAKRATENTEAYELYLRGRFHWSKWTEDGLRESIAFFEQALSKDPSFALAYSGLAAAYGVLSYFNPDTAQAHGAILQAKACAHRALELDEAQAESHLVLGNMANFNDWDFPTAERELRLAIELNPSLSDAHQSYSMSLMNQCRFDEAIAEMELAVELDPLSVPANMGWGFLLFNIGRYGEALTQISKSIELEPTISLAENDPTFHIAHQLLGGCLEQLRKYEEAVAEYLTMIREWPGKAEMSKAVLQAFFETGMSGFWRRFAEFAPELVERRLITPLFAACVYASIGDKDGAFEWIEKALGARLPSLSHIQADPRFETLRSDPRFDDVLRRMGVSRKEQLDSGLSSN
ncbi:MAG TPA: protein kinase [Blastocatellia bacterium]|nr:protein kinase [Blastocatellia bacterium]